MSRYVLHDFAKADHAWLEPMIDAIAEAAGRLAASDDARFLTDVARRLQGAQRVSEPQSNAQAPAPRKSEAPGQAHGTAPKPTAQQPATPPAEPAATPIEPPRGGLADSLKRWLRGK